MWLKSINLKNVYSFGKTGTPELSDFKQLNLFIGKNGSGKSNVFRAICDLDVIPIHDKRTERYAHHLGNSANSWNIHLNHSRPEPDTFRDIQIKLDNHEIEFKNGYHIKGDFKMYSGKYISHDSSILSFKEKLHDIKRSNAWPAVLSFGLSYIFQLDFSFRAGEITEWFTIQGEGKKGTNGKPVFNFENWSSGFFSVSNLLIEFLRADKRVICIDEPEVHLEPRILRRVLEILIWISTRGNTSRDIQSSDLLDSIEIKWVHWFENSTWKESPEWKNEDGLKHFKPRQIFFSSHSSVLINEFIKYPELCAIYEFDRSLQDTSYVADFGKTSRNVKQKSVISQVRKIGTYPHSILDNLGAHGSDILQTNGIIWVEGPSDVVYIRKWLDMYAIENIIPKLKQGADYEFQMYGGTLLDSICLMNKGHSEQDELKKLVSMFSFSRNAFVITDSDAIQKDDGIIKDQSNFKNAKEFIASEFEKLSNLNYSLGLWYKKNNTNIRTLENYLDDKTIKKFSSQKDSGLTKKIYAQMVTNRWDDKKSLTDFKHSLSDEIETLYGTIVSWNK